MTIREWSPGRRAEHLESKHTCTAHARSTQPPRAAALLILHRALGTSAMGQMGRRQERSGLSAALVPKALLLARSHAHPGDGQSRGSIRGCNLASSSAESIDLDKAPDPSKMRDSSNSPNGDWVVSPDSRDSSASSLASSGMLSPNCSALGEGLTSC